MPGSIQVSVLDFKDFSSSSVFVKVSLGKIEYQARTKGAFSFPLTTLRNNLIITLEDAEGNQISHAEVQTVAIVEKGIWDDLFPLKGGGYTHMKLQFILSEEERNRIRMMREAALKNKQREILNSSLRSPESASTASDPLASSLCNHEVSDSQTSALHNVAMSSRDLAVKGGQLSNLDTFNKDPTSGDGIKTGTIPSQTTKPDATDILGKTPYRPMSEGFEVHQKALAEKINSQSPYTDVPARPMLLQEASSMFVNKTWVYTKLANDLAEKPGKQYAVEKIDSHVKKPSVEGIPAPSSQGTEVNIFKKSETQLQHADISTRLQEEASNEKGFSKSVIAEKIKSVSPDVAAIPEKQGPLEKNPSNIRKMISAFESSLSQDKGPPVKPLYKAGMVRQVFKNVNEKAESPSESLKNPVMSSLGKLKSSFSTGDLQRNSTIGDKNSSEKDTGGFQLSEAFRQLKESSSTKIQSKETDSVKGALKLARKEMNPKEMGKSTPETAMVSGRLNEQRDSAVTLLVRSEFKSAQRENETWKSPGTMERSSVDAATVLRRMHNEKDSAENSVLKTTFNSPREASNSKDLLKSPIDVTRPSTLEAATDPVKMHGEKNSAGTFVIKHELKSAHREGNTEEMLKSPREFIRPSTVEAGTVSGRMDEYQDSVGTSVVEHKGRERSSNNSSHEIDIRGASNDQGMDLVGSSIEERGHHGKKSSAIPENVEKDKVHYGTDGEVKKGEGNSHRLRSSSPKSSAEDSSSGLLGQAIKIAIVVGFGVLVLLTRQRRPRKGNQKENDPPFTTEDFMDVEGSIEDQLRKINILKLS